MIILPFTKGRGGFVYSKITFSFLGYLTSYPISKSSLCCEEMVKSHFISPVAVFKFPLEIVFTSTLIASKTATGI